MQAGRRGSAARACALEVFGLLVVMGLVLLVRALGFEWIFQGDQIVFPPADAQYHLRRAFYSFARFPDVLLFDPYINFPGGASVPWPPLFDFTLAGVAWLFASDQHGFELVMAWAGPVLAALCVLPIHATARRLASPGAGLAAGAFFAFLPVSVTYSRVGNADHHSAVCLLGAWLLYLCTVLADPGLRGRRLARLGCALALARLMLLLTWHGSLLYLGLVESCLALAAVASGRRALWLAQSLSALGSLALLLPVLALSPTPLGGEYSSIALSRLHAVALLAVAGVAAALYGLERRRAAAGAGGRFVRLALVAGTAAAIVLALPGPRHGLEPALRFLSLSDEAGAWTGEQSPLFALFGRAPLRPAVLVWGGFAWLLWCAPLTALLLARRRSAPAHQRATAWMLCAWSAFFGALAIGQRRYGNDLAPAASLLLPLALYLPAHALACRGLRPGLRRPAAIGLALLAWALLIAPPVRSVYLPRLHDSWLALRGDARVTRAARLGVAASLARFARDVRRVTPETAGYLGGDAQPEYGVLAHANLGHALQYVARRATASDPFWAYIGHENWRRSFAFQAAKSERDALRLARALRGRYVVSMPGADAGSIVEQLQRADGRALPGRPRLSHFRLITEAARGGLPIAGVFGSSRGQGIPYKLFEIVEGALLEVPAAPGVEIEVRLAMRTASGRRIVDRVRTVAGADGIARSRLPYASERVAEEPAATRALGLYRVRVGAREYRVRVSERAVLGGETIRCCAG